MRARGIHGCKKLAVNGAKAKKSERGSRSAKGRELVAFNRRESVQRFERNRERSSSRN